MADGLGDRFTEQVGRILDLAREEADRVGHRYVGPEHLVLGLLRDGGSPAAGMLQARGVELDELHDVVAAGLRQAVPERHGG